jgi:hypothetical protein
VSTLTIGRGAATPRSVVNFSMGFPSRNAGINGLLRARSSCVLAASGKARFSGF